MMCFLIDEESRLPLVVDTIGIFCSECSHVSVDSCWVGKLMLLLDLSEHIDDLDAVLFAILNNMFDKLGINRPIDELV